MPDLALRERDRLYAPRMSAAASLDHTYRYPFASALEAEGTGRGLRLAGDLGHVAEGSAPLFFRGTLREPEVACRMMAQVSEVVRSRFYLPGTALLLDPVVTAGDEILRMEGFSSCCGVYARLDLGEGAFETDVGGRGTTNVDFNARMRGALSKVQPGDHITLAVGSDGVELARGKDSVFEKKVRLPVRWLKGFVEAQAYQAALEPWLEVSAAEALRFVRSLPRGGAPKRPSWALPIGTPARRGLRLSHSKRPGGLFVVGTDRLRLLEPLLPYADSLRIWHDAASRTSAWEIVRGGTRMTLLVSPEIWRGFSGEGQVLERLARGDGTEALAQVLAQLRWQARLAPADVAAAVNLDENAVQSALALLAARGLVGFDAGGGAYFHRELPFDLDLVEALQPRLRAARKLLAASPPRPIGTVGGAQDFAVTGGASEHVVQLGEEGGRCSCRWYSRHPGERGPCKHILAVRMHIEASEAPGV